MISGLIIAIRKMGGNKKRNCEINNPEKNENVRVCVMMYLAKEGISMTNTPLSKNIQTIFSAD